VDLFPVKNEDEVLTPINIVEQNIKEPKPKRILAFVLQDKIEEEKDVESKSLKLDPPQGFNELGTKGRNLTR
jgi:hypothetical protein